MRKIALAATVSALAFAGSAQAGDFYIGLSAGHDFANVEGVDTTPGGGNPARYDYGAQGGNIGLLAGFNYTNNNLLFGLEADGNYADINDDQIAPAPVNTYKHYTEINWTAAARARLGIIHGNNVVYVAGGYAVAGVDMAVGFAASSPTTFHSYSESRAGWTLGGGVDHAFDETLSGRIEYRYSDYGETSNLKSSASSLDTNELTSHGIRFALIMKM